MATENTRVLIAFLSFFISIGALAFSYYSFIVNQKQSVKPVLIFINEGKKSSEDEIAFWYVANVGEATAINIKLVAGYTSATFNTNKVVGLSALPKGYKCKLCWIKDDRKDKLDDFAFGAVYQDTVNRNYTTIAYENKNTIHEGEKILNLTPQIYPWGMDRVFFEKF